MNVASADTSNAVACIGCAKNRWKRECTGAVDYLTGERFDVWRCRGCGLGRTDPVPQDLARHYPERYRGNRHSFTDQMRLKLRYRRIARFSPHQRGSRIIDIGCGTGNFARLCAAQGWSVAATEMDESILDTLNPEGIEAFTPDEAMEQPWENEFDAATIWHVLEHVRDPQATLEWASRILKPGGVLHVSVPEFASLQAKMAGKHWLHLDVPRHLWHFTHAALSAMVKRAGFDVVSRNSVVIEYDWFGYIQSTLNMITTRPNVLFDRLIHGSNTPDTPRRDIVLSMLLAPLLAAKSLPTVAFTAMTGLGATLDLVCRKRA